MIIRILLIIAAFNQLTACIAIPRIEHSEQINFTYQPDQKQVSASDLLCCADCTAS